MDDGKALDRMNWCDTHGRYDECGFGHLSESEKMQGELEPLPGAKWDGTHVGELIKHGRD